MPPKRFPSLPMTSGPTPPMGVPSATSLLQEASIVPSSQDKQKLLQILRVPAPQEPALGGPACSLQPPPVLIGCCPCRPGAGVFSLSLGHVLLQPPWSMSRGPSLCVPLHSASHTVLSRLFPHQNFYEPQGHAPREAPNV